MEEKIIEGIKYSLDKSTLTATVIGKEDYSGDIVIPAFVVSQGVSYKVISIGNNAFERCKSLTSITIPDSVKVIGNWAFYGCESLISITIPNSVTTIGEWAFFVCRSLTSIIIPGSVTSIGKRAFAHCTSLTSIIVDENNKKYDSRENCNAIIETATNTLIACCNKTIIPNSVITIGEAAFEGCDSLTSITIPDGVTTIGEWAFNVCQSLTSIIIPGSVTSIGERAFAHCTSLTSILVDENNKVYDSRENCNAIIETATNTLIVGCGKTIIPNSVITIGEVAFFNCPFIISITIPNSVITIGEAAFNRCRSISSVIIPDGVISIGWYAFLGCTSLVDIRYNGTIEQWQKIELGEYWNEDVPSTNVHCIDGDVEI